MRCSMRNCKNVRDIDPTSKLCPPCNTWFKDKNKMLSSQESQSPQLSNDSAPIIDDPPAPDTSRPTSSSRARTPGPPPIDIMSIQNKYNILKNSSTESPAQSAMLDMLALMLNIYSKLSATEAIRCEIEKANQRLDALEAKVGRENEVSERLGLAVRSLPLPSPGHTDLDIVKQILSEIKAPGIDVDRDVVKAVRKIPSKPINSSQPILGTVLVEMKNEESRASIMKNKHTLQHHPDCAIRRVAVKNMKSREQMLIEKIGNNILKKIPGYENHFVGGNGHIRDSLDNVVNHPSTINPAVRPLHFRSQNLPSRSQPIHQPPKISSNSDASVTA